MDLLPHKTDSHCHMKLVIKISKSLCITVGQKDLKNCIIENKTAMILGTFTAKSEPEACQFSIMASVLEMAPLFKDKN